MLNNRVFATFAAATLAMAFGFANDALAAKKQLTYDQAYAKCKGIMDKQGTYGTSTMANERYTRGAACMKKYGHNL